MDFNGVIIDDEPIQMRAYQEMLAAENIVLTDEEYYSSLGMDDHTFVVAAYERAGKKADANKILEITQGKTSKWHDIISGSVPLFDGAENFIRKMANDFTLGIVSMAKREEIGFVLEKTGLDECFSIIVSAEDVNACKPDPQCYRIGFRMIDNFRTSNEHLPMIHSECLVIEDSPPGVIAGRGAGLSVLGVTNTVSAEALREAGAEWTAWSLDDWMPDAVRRAFA